MNATPGSRSCLYDEAELEVLLDAMALQAAKLLQGRRRVALIGILRRGAPLADRLAERLVRLHGLTQPLRLDLKVKRYADDLTLLHPQTQLTEQPEHAGIDLSGRVVVIVDDVLYCGFSMFRAVQYLLTKGVKTVYTVVLVDRACATLPIHADVSGLVLQVAPGHIVECHVPPYEPVWQIVLVQPATPD